MEEERPHRDRLDAVYAPAFRSLMSAWETCCAPTGAVFVSFDTEGRYIAHRAFASDSAEGAFSVLRHIDADSFRTDEFQTAFAACRRIRAFKTTPFVWSRNPEARPIVLASVPVYVVEKEPVAYLICIAKPSESETELFASLNGLALAYAAMIRAEAAAARCRELEGKLIECGRAARLNDSLYRTARQIHARTDVDSVLTGLIDGLHELEPAGQFELYLSQDHFGSAAFVKRLDMQADRNDLCSRAFMDGRMLTEEAEDGTRRAAVPLRGKQGVYGVLHVFFGIAPVEPGLLDRISLMADAAGSAFENARLFEQSNRLVQELRLINDITQRLNQSLKLNDIFQFVSNEFIQVFDAEFACILEVDKARHELVVRASRPSSFSRESFALDYGFSGRVIATKEPLLISDYRADSSVKSVWMEATGARSLLASPITADGETVGVIMVAHRHPNYFTYDKFKLLQLLSGHIGLAIANASLHAEVRRMAQTDRLTGLYARHYLDETIGVQQRKDGCGSLIVVDIDDFKKVNDTYGHQVGDEVLIHVCAIIRSCIREGDIASRWGGEELAVYLPQVTKEQAMRVAERICRRVRAETRPQVTVSCGVSDWNLEDEKISVESLFYRADMALYKAKHAGKNQIRIG